MVHIIVSLAVFVLIALVIPAILFVSLVWTHRPDLSVFDIFREAAREIKHEIKNTIAGKVSRQKGKTK